MYAVVSLRLRLIWVNFMSIFWGAGIFILALLFETMECSTARQLLRDAVVHIEDGAVPSCCSPLLHQQRRALSRPGSARWVEVTWDAGCPGFLFFLWARDFCPGNADLGWH
jgi:hypothetical protein